jgi:hypothetical protein
MLGMFAELQSFTLEYAAKFYIHFNGFCAEDESLSDG